MSILHKIHLHLSIYFYVCASLHYFAKVLKYIHRQRDNQSLGQPVAVTTSRCDNQSLGISDREHMVNRNRKLRERLPGAMR